MIEPKGVARWIITALTESLRESIKKLLIVIFLAIAAFLLWIFLEGVIMLLTYEVAVFWLFVVVIFSAIPIGLLYRAKHVKLPKAVDKAITVEKNPDWGISHPYKDIVQNRRGVPYLQFYMRVINRTYYYFEPDDLVICCLFDNHKLCDTWNSKVKTKETNIELDNLHECEDGTIMVRFPIKERYANLRKWKLDGTVTYKLKGSVIKANKQYTRPEIGIHIEYELPEEQITKLKEEVKKKKALGDKQ